MIKKVRATSKSVRFEELILDVEIKLIADSLKKEEAETCQPC